MKQTLIVILYTFFATVITNAQNQAKENLRAENNYRKADRELMDVYQKVLKLYAADSVFISYFMESERCWIRFRDAQVNMKYPPHAGNYYGIQATYCVYSYNQQLTEDRIKTLKEWLKGKKEGEKCLDSRKQFQ